MKTQWIVSDSARKKQSLEHPAVHFFGFAVLRYASLSARGFEGHGKELGDPRVAELTRFVWDLLEMCDPLSWYCRKHTRTF